MTLNWMLVGIVGIACFLLGYGAAFLTDAVMRKRIVAAIERGCD